jgi:hypothetical protein
MKGMNENGDKLENPSADNQRGIWKGLLGIYLPPGVAGHPAGYNRLLDLEVATLGREPAIQINESSIGVALNVFGETADRAAEDLSTVKMSILDIFGITQTAVYEENVITIEQAIARVNGPNAVE